MKSIEKEILLIKIQDLEKKLEEANKKLEETTEQKEKADAKIEALAARIALGDIEQWERDEWQDEYEEALKYLTPNQQFTIDSLTIFTPQKRRI